MPIRERRRLPIEAALLVGVLSLAGCTGDLGLSGIPSTPKVPADRGPGAGAASHVHLDWTRPPSLVPTGAASGDEALFVRLAGIELAGDHDGWIDREEVAVFLETGSRVAKVFDGQASLEDDGLTELDARSVWIELPATDRFDVYVSAHELSGFTWRLLTSMETPVEVVRDPERTEAIAERKFDLRPIARADGGEPITGATVTLHALWVPRRDRDGTSQKVIAGLFADLLREEGPPKGRALATLLRGVDGEARGAAAGSTHTHLRRVIPELRELAREVGRGAPAASEPVDRAAVQAAQRAVEEAAAGERGKADLRERALGHASRKLPADGAGREPWNTWHTEVLLLRKEMAGGEYPGMKTSGPTDAALHALSMRIGEARFRAGLPIQQDAALTKLLDAVRAETGRPN